MGLNSYFFDFMMPWCGTQPNRKALSAGYPDFLVSPEILLKHLGKSDFPADPKSAEIIVGHRVTHIGYSRDPFHVFDAMGYSLDVIDAISHRGVELVYDLNRPIPSGFQGKYDLVLDHGTLEHCFNIGQAAVNLASSVKHHGLMVSHLPLNMYNHGFYNINPNWYWEFYQSNGFEILDIEGWSMHETDKPFPLKLQEIFYDAPEASLVNMVARRVVMKQIEFPIQGIYKR